MVDIEEKDIDT